MQFAGGRSRRCFPPASFQDLVRIRWRTTSIPAPSIAICDPSQAAKGALGSLATAARAGHLAADFGAGVPALRAALGNFLVEGLVPEEAVLQVRLAQTQNGKDEKSTTTNGREERTEGSGTSTQRADALTGADWPASSRSDAFRRRPL